LTELTPPSALPQVPRSSGEERGSRRDSLVTGFKKSRPSWYVPVVSVASTMLVVGVASYFIWQSDSRPVVEKQFLNRDKFWDSLPDVVGGFWLDIQMFLIAETAILILRC